MWSNRSDSWTQHDQYASFIYQKKVSLNYKSQMQDQETFDTQAYLVNHLAEPTSALQVGPSIKKKICAPVPHTYLLVRRCDQVGSGDVLVAVGLHVPAVPWAVSPSGEYTK